MTRHFRLTYYPWITQHVEPSTIHENVARFAGLVEQAFDGILAGATLEVLPPMEVPAQIEALQSQRDHIALMNPLGLAFARAASPSIEPLAVAQRIIDGTVGTTYFAQLYVRRAADVADIGQVKGTSIGYGVPYSTSNFVVPAHLLLRAGVHPLLSFKQIAFTGGHDKAALAVYRGEVTVGAGHDGVLADLARKPGYEDAQDVLQTLVRSDPIPSDPVAVNLPGREEQEAIRRALLAAAATPRGKESIAIFWGNAQGLAATEGDDYGGLLRAVEALRFTGADLLGSR
jgi:ABC-type phosphate/phosphonate transport system substrate-binding protein